MIDKERIMDDINGATELLDRLEMKVGAGCPCGCLAIVSERTKKAQTYGSIDEITYLNVLGFAGPAFRQAVSRGAAAETAGQTTFECFLEAVAIVRSCAIVSHVGQREFPEMEGGCDDAE